jgi:hypothetical protein
MAYNQKSKAGRGNMVKTGRGIPSSLKMSGSPLNVTNFPVKPGMKLATYEAVVDSRTGEMVDPSVVANAKPGDDLSYLEGVTNLSALSGGKYMGDEGRFDNSYAGTYNIQNRIAGPQGTVNEYSSVLYPEVSEQPGIDVTTGEQVVPLEGYSLLKSKNMRGRVARTEDQINRYIQDYNMPNSTRDYTFGIVADRPVTADGKPLYTTARVTGQQDFDEIPNVSKYDFRRGGYKKGGTIGETTNLTQRNINFPRVFSEQEIKDEIQKNPSRFYREYNPQDRNTSFRVGYTGPRQGSNIQGQYTSMDFKGKMQAPKNNVTQSQASQQIRLNPDINNERDLRRSYISKYANFD